MARVSVNVKTKAIGQNNQDGDHIPPPSTLAAQIVEHQKRPNGHAVFLQLLEEIRASPSALEDDVDSNHKLISVILEAGLHAVAADDLVFSRSDEAVSHAIACLDVIEIAFKRNPDVLFHVDPDTADQNLPLCFQLLSKLFLLWKYDNITLLRKRLEDLLVCFLMILQETRGAQEAATLLFKLFEVCTNDICEELQRCVSKSKTTSLNLLLPSSKARGLLTSVETQPLAVKHTFQSTVTRPRYALAIMLSLITVISRSCTSSGSSRAQHSANVKVQTWLFRTLTRVKTILWVGSTAIDPTTSDTVAGQYLIATFESIQAMRLPGSCTLVLEKTAFLAIDHICYMLSRLATSELDLCEAQLLEGTKLLQSISEKSVRVSERLRLYLLPHLSKSDTASPRLQTAFRQLFPITLPASLCDSDIEMKDMGLDGDSAHMVLERPTKRRKHDHSTVDNTYFEAPQAVLQAFCEDFDVRDTADLHDLETRVAETLSQPLDMNKILRSLLTFTKLPCLGAVDATEVDGQCDICQKSRLSSTWTQQQWSSYHRVLSTFLSNADLQSSKAARASLLVAIRHFVGHTPAIEHLDLTKSLGFACLQGMRSSAREVRIASVNALPGFLKHTSDTVGNIVRQNRITALDLLQQTLEGQDARLWESSIRALGLIATTCDDEEMNIVLLRLVECLGSTNNLVCELAQLELQDLAHAIRSSLDDIFRPFWKTIAISVVKDLQARPQKAQKLAEILGRSVDELLLHTQEDVVPFLVLWRHTDVLQRIANARAADGSIRQLCMQPKNMTLVLALLLIQDPKHLESTIQGYLIQASTEFRKVSVSEMLRADVVPVACELLRTASDMDDAAQQKIMNAFLQFAMFVEGDGKLNRANDAGSETTALFFRKHLLGMLTLFSEAIDNPGQIRSQKIRHLKAMKLMIALARNDIVIALPQIRACLQSALNMAPLRDQALSTWLALLEALEDDNDLVDLVIQTFTVILHNWNDLSFPAQHEAHEAVLAMLRNKQRLIGESVLLIPSLQGISLMSKLESHLSKLRDKEDTSKRVRAFSQRCQNENANVVLQALRELVPYLTNIQAWLNDSVMSEQPQSAISELVRALLDICSRFGETEAEILDLCAQCLGAIGCLDPVRVEAPRQAKEIIVLSNFELAGEAVDFVVFLLETVLVKAFHSAPNPRAQGFLAYVMQELLKFCDFTPAVTTVTRPSDHDFDDAHGNWQQMSESARSTLAPLLSSRYVLKINVSNDVKQKYPIFDASSTHGTWLRTMVYDLLRKASGDNAKKIFGTLSRIIRGYGTSISSFLLPFVALNVIIGGTVLEVAQVKEELLAVLMFPSTDTSPPLLETLRSCSENVFQVLDYLSKWLQAKRKSVAAKEAVSNSTPYHELDRAIDNAQVTSVEEVLAAIPADVIASRAVECGAHSRALFYWEQYMRQQRDSRRVQSMAVTDLLLEREQHYHRLHSIYAEIDEPDGIEGISHYIQVFEPDEQILEHEKNGRWGAAQSWYESYVNDEPDVLGNHLDLMTCLQRAGRHTMVLDHGKTCYEDWPDSERLLSLMSEAAWSTTKRLPDMVDFIGDYKAADDAVIDFNIGIGKVLLEESSEKSSRKTPQILRDLRLSIAKSLSPATTASLQSCHDQMLKLHALYEIDVLSKCQTLTSADKIVMHTSLSRRLDIVGSYLPDKQYLLGIRRAIMSIKTNVFSEDDMSQLWLDSAKLARKGNRSEVAYNAVLNAIQLGDDSAKIEQSRLLWKSGEHRKAIQSLEGAILSDAFVARSIQDTASMQALAATATSNMPQDQNILVAKANLLLAKWLDKAGQTQSTIINSKYQLAVKSFARWEKGLYYLGKFYNKLLESNKALPPSKQDGSYLHGDHAKLVVENYLRSLVFGCKYLFETMPKLLTLWLDFGIEATKPLPKDAPDEVKVKALHVRPERLDAMNKQVRKYSDKIPPYMFYPALAQMITRVCHPNAKVYDVLAHIIVKVVTHHPQQALWPLLATAKSSANDRAGRGIGLLNKVKEKANKTIRNDGNSVTLRDMITKGQKLSEQLLRACEVSIGERTTGIVSLTRDLGFNKSVASCPLVVPVEKTLTASLPTPAADYHTMKTHRAFPSTSEAVVISSFTDDVLVLNSLQKPRKLTARGSDGRKYGLLCKPKDDLRKDQRLMEFNAMVNRAMKKDTECSQRRLYVRTYAVTPLNEECGIIEWVDGLKALRDIILHIYRSRGITMNYTLLRELLNQSCSKPENHIIFTNQVLQMYPAVLHDWFTDTFSDPESWFAARLRYTRSAAVTSIVGNALGLGDRHGENVMLEEGTGGVFHVDFNCLFEKGLTFEKPEVVPFRLTQNMVDACGVYGVEGPFRRSAECCAKVMRASEDALLTILETFVYDPTADFMGPGGRRNRTKGVPETPKEILESTSGKLRGLLRGENVPLSVEGHVDALIRQATDPANLCQLYVGWLSCL